MSKRVVSSEHGQSMVLIALVMVALLGVLGLMLDGGNAYLSRRDAQNASDAAAFAGGKALRQNGITDQGVRGAIDSFAHANHVANPSIDVIAYYLDKNGNQIPGNQVGSNGNNPPASGATGVVVTSTINFNSFFLSMVTGGGPTGIPARAKVQTGMLTSPGGPLVPMVVPLPLNCDVTQIWPNSQTGCGHLQPGSVVDLVGTTTTAGNVQWLNLLEVNPTGPVPSCNENCMAQFIAGDHNPPPPNVKIGDWLQANSGISTNKCTGGQTKDTSIICALDYWLAKPETERRWIVPIYKIDNGGTGNTEEYQVIAFATFYLTGYHMAKGAGWESNMVNQYCTNPFTGQPADPVHPDNPKCIEGKFVQFTTPPGEVDPGQQCNVNAINVCGVQLSE